jgi:hypothetical protein
MSVHGNWLCSDGARARVCMCSDLKPGALAGLSWFKRSPSLANRTSVLFLVLRRRMKSHFRRSVNCFYSPRYVPVPVVACPFRLEIGEQKAKRADHVDLISSSKGKASVINQTIWGGSSATSRTRVQKPVR